MLTIASFQYKHNRLKLFLTLPESVDNSGKETPNRIKRSKYVTKISPINLFDDNQFTLSDTDKKQDERSN